MTQIVTPHRSADDIPDLEALRADVRAWCELNVPTDWRESQTGATAEQFVEFQQRWFSTLRAGGLAVPHWPAEHGGGFTLSEQAVLFEEFARAEAPRLVLQFISLHHAAATLLTAGTDKQLAEHLPAILDGEVWCQGFSEPEAGSDLVSLRTRAVRDGDHYVVNGQKIWASLAMHADWCLLLARTSVDAPARKGISYLLMDMKSPGLTVRPIKQSSGEEHFCEIFLSDVRIPVSNLVGEENQGWQVAQRTLTSERGATMVELSERLAVGYDWLVELARTTLGDDLATDTRVRQDLAALATEVSGLRILTARAIAEAEAPVTARSGGGASASVIKLYYSELLQRLTHYGMQLTGLDGQVADEKPTSAGWESGHWLLDYIGSWEWTIPGGTSEIQRNIIAERGLGLPREPVTT
ncbi:acyl-CoA dehydrogenase family protein [Rhodococcoides yunnanense]|uniref:acyl-CoA dehydrogenase family protein n=1 Tax=Rhodococcoides yunnanense TaxID=278209 RepID=UPI00093224C5|nr:acyl-CoA dehydrogenase family protein [Rhodococcus yunnanensis]